MSDRVPIFRSKFFRPWSDLLKRVAGAPRGADWGRNNGKSEAKHPLGATGNMPTRSSAVFWAQEGVHLCHLDRNTGDHGEKPLKNIDFRVRPRPLLFSRGARPLFFEGAAPFSREKSLCFREKTCGNSFVGTQDVRELCNRSKIKNLFFRP